MTFARLDTDRIILSALLGVLVSVTFVSGAGAQHALLAPGDKGPDIARLLERARGGGEIDDDLCLRVLWNRAASCRVFGGLQAGRFLSVGVRSYDDPSVRPYAMLLDTVSEYAVFTPRLLWLDAQGQRIVVSDEHAVRVFDFGSKTWQYLGDCIAAELAPDRESVACIALDESLSRISLSSPFTQCELLSNASARSRIEPPDRFARQYTRIAFEARPDGDFRVKASIVRRGGSRDFFVQLRGRPRADRNVRISHAIDAWNSSSGRCERTTGSASVPQADEGSNATTFTQIDGPECERMVSERLPSGASCRVWTPEASNHQVVEICKYVEARSGRCMPSLSGRTPTIVVTNPARPSRPARATFDGDVVLVGVLGPAHSMVLMSMTGLWSFDYEQNTVRFIGHCWHPVVSATHAAIACLDSAGRARVYARRGALWGSLVSTDRAPVAGIVNGEGLGTIGVTESNALLQARVSLFDGVSRNTGLVPFDAYHYEAMNVRVALPDEARGWFGGP